MTGQDSARQSKKTFCLAFKRFCEFLENDPKMTEQINDLNPEDFYKWARCGLFHSAVLSHKLLIDAIGSTNFPFCQNPVLEGWLVNPWSMLHYLEAYVIDYANELHNNTNGQLYSCFIKTYKRLIDEPMKHFCSHVK